jgi:hypothetical protein
MLASIDDGAIYAIVPDADDRAAIHALGHLSEVEGDVGAAARSETLAATRVALVPMMRVELLETLTTVSPGAWAETSLALLRAPPPGALLVAYDGSPVGHGVVAIGALVSRGGSA